MGRNEFEKALAKRYGKTMAKEMMAKERMRLSKCAKHEIELSDCPACGQAICKECLD